MIPRCFSFTLLFGFGQAVLGYIYGVVRIRWHIRGNKMSYIVVIKRTFGLKINLDDGGNWELARCIAVLRAVSWSDNSLDKMIL